MWINAAIVSDQASKGRGMHQKETKIGDTQKLSEFGAAISQMAAVSCATRQRSRLGRKLQTEKLIEISRTLAVRKVASPKCLHRQFAMLEGSRTNILVI